MSRSSSCPKTKLSRLETASLGRLVTCIGGEPEIFPVNFVVQTARCCFGPAREPNYLSP